MALNAATLNVTTSSATYALPTKPTGTYALKNIGANVIWVLHDASGTAAADADECEAIPAGETIYTQGYDIAGVKAIIAIAVTGTTKLNVVTDMERW